MVRNRHLARSITNMGFFKFRQQLEYRAAIRGDIFLVENRFYASSKKCSACGEKSDDLPLSAGEGTCPACGVVHDRDVNAAINLKNTSENLSVVACGKEGS